MSRRGAGNYRDPWHDRLWLRDPRQGEQYVVGYVKGWMGENGKRYVDAELGFSDGISRINVCDEDPEAIERAMAFCKRFLRELEKAKRWQRLEKVVETPTKAE